VGRRDLREHENVKGKESRGETLASCVIKAYYADLTSPSRFTSEEWVVRKKTQHLDSMEDTQFSKSMEGLRKSPAKNVRCSGF